MTLDRRTLLLAGAGAAAGSLLAAGVRAAEEEPMFHGERTGDWVDLIAPNGAPILRYQREHPLEGEKAAAVEGGCYTHPLYTPAGDLVTDLGPADHPHHRGIFCAWIALEGEKRGDWWGWGAKAPKDGRLLLNREARVTEEGEKSATLRVINSWRAEDETVLGERVTIAVSQIAGANVVDYEFKFTAPTKKAVVIDASPFGGFCYRARPRGTLVVSGPEGKVDRPDAVYNKPEMNWPAAKWYDLSYRAPEGAVTGVAVMDHPENPKSTWHVVRGIHMLNPCIVADGPVTLQYGEPLYLRYRVVAHDGDAGAVDLAALHAAFTAAK